MDAVVTGAAGFIGSHTVEYLRSRGDAVRGIDCYTDFYDPAVKGRNVAQAGGDPPLPADLTTADIAPLIDGADTVIHLAGQPGVRPSWSSGFEDYVSRNILATQRLLEACRDRPGVRVVVASSSSVYGNAERYPTTEQDLPAPHSPYGVTKLAAEHLCGVYASNMGVDVTSLRFFSVYGPRQRPDMALHRMIEGALTGTPFPLYGDGGQERDFTYVADIVAAITAVADHRSILAGRVFNVASGQPASVRDLLGHVEDALGAPVAVELREAQPGDVRRTGGSIAELTRATGWTPTTGLADGVRLQADWHRSLRTGR